jgi:hypothetical protein
MGMIQQKQACAQKELPMTSFLRRQAYSPFAPKRAAGC